MSNILFLCTSNYDRSPALEQYFAQKYPQHKYKSAGVNRYFTGQKESHYLTDFDLMWSDVIVCMEDIHYDVLQRDFNKLYLDYRKVVILDAGHYERGNTDVTFLKNAEEKMKFYRLI